MLQSFKMKNGKLSVLKREGKGPPVLWLGGFRSDMQATKAEALDAYAAREGQAFIRFDYSGHGASGGRFEDGTISLWLEDTLAVIAEGNLEKPILVGSSMGGWLALLAARKLKEAPSSLVLIAPAVDFTQRLIWDRFGETERRILLEDGFWLENSSYSDIPYPITLSLIEDGRNHCLLDGPIDPRCPVHILQGMNDTDVP